MLTSPSSPAKERGPTGVHSSRKPRDCQPPQASWARASEITAGQDGEALPYPPARPWSWGRGNGEVVGTAAAPLSSRGQPPQAREDLSPGRTSAPGASGMHRLRRPGRTKPHLAPVPARRFPAPPRPGTRPRPWLQAPPPGSDSVGTLAPPTASDAELVKVVVPRP